MIGLKAAYGVAAVAAAIGVVAGGQTLPTKRDPGAESTVIMLPSPPRVVAAVTPRKGKAPRAPEPQRPKFYKIEERPMTQWGDYGSILQHGMTAHLNRFHGLLSLERTGPYMPPITFPGIGDVVLTDSGRKLLEESGLSGFSFQPVHKARIVKLAWEQWDLTTRRPPQYPPSGEPEDFILDRPANKGVADEMGNLWELVIPVTARIGRPRDFVRSFRELWVERDSWNGADVFRGDSFGGPLMSERAKAWFEEHLGTYAQFEEFASR